MKLTTFLPTRVARRVLAWFVLCTVVPGAVLAVVAYLQVADQLERDAVERLRQEAKSTGQIVFDRLQRADRELVRRAEPSAGRGPAEPAGLLGGVRLLGEPGPRSEIGQTLVAGGPRDRFLREHRPVLVQSGDSLLVVREITGDEGATRRVAAAVDSAAFWGARQGLSLVPSNLDLCVIAGERPLYCTGPDAIPPVDAATTSFGALTWTTSLGDAVVGAEWSLFLGYEFGADPWRVVVSESADSILAPLAAFRHTFWLVVALVLVAAFTLGNVTIRRTMEPLQRLETGTRRLADGDLDHRLRDAGDDEFGVVSRAFNSMAASLQLQFRTLDQLNLVARQALAEPEVHAIARVGAEAGRVLLAAEVSVVVRSGEGEQTWLRVSERAGASGPTECEVLLAPAEQRVLRQGGGWEWWPGPDPGSGPAGGRPRVFPIRAAHEPVGGLIVESAVADPNDVWLSHGRLLADQIGVALANARLLRQLDDMSHGAMVALARTIDANSPWTAGHSERVTRVALAAARQMDVGEADLALLRRGGLLHDIGKIGVPASILNKAGPLDDEEWAIMRDHPVAGARILAPIAAFRPIVPMVRWHHERLDGSGYPDRIGGNEIPLLARILAVADVYDALTSERPYRPSMSVEYTVGYLTERAGLQFDPVVVEAIRAVLAHDPEVLLGTTLDPLPAVRASGSFAI